MTLQQKLKETLEKLPYARKEILVYGSQIMITCFSDSAAEKWLSALADFATPRIIANGVDEKRLSNGEIEYQNVVRVWATI